MHPHRHGATALQVGGGANCVIIVEDEDGTLPTEVQNAREVIFIAQYFDVEELREVAQTAGDNVFSISGHSTNEFVTVNGQMNPTIEVDAGEWIRLRVVWVNFLQGNLDLRISNCEMQLLAKDGVYIRDYPRQIFEAEVPSGGRADIVSEPFDAPSRLALTMSSHFLVLTQPDGPLSRSFDDLHHRRP